VNAAVKVLVSVCFWGFGFDSEASTSPAIELQKLVNKASCFEEVVDEVGRSKDEELDAIFISQYLDSYENVVEKFLPNASSICTKIFPLMTAKQIATTLDVLVRVLDKKCWFYFESSKKELSKSKLDALIRELDIFSQFLRTARVDEASEKLAPEKTSAEKTVLLVDFLKTNLKVNSYLRVQGMLLDLLFLRMYSFALKPNAQYSEIRGFEQFKLRIESILTELNNSIFERYYKEKLRIANIFFNSFAKQLELVNPIFLPG
jgi:hypothetical protein